MSSTIFQPRPVRARYSAVPRPYGRGWFALWDALFVVLAGLHGAVLLAAPAVPVIALGVWWNSNTIAHNFIHRPFFRDPRARGLFSAYLSVLLGIPQTMWRDRHLAHHAGVEWRLRVTPQFVVEAVLVLSLWGTLAVANPRFLLMVYLPGYCLGLALCGLQGHYEHALGATSHYGRVYNVLCFNDGYHAEHHARPGLHWTALPGRVEPGARTSRWPAPLRWLESFSLEGLERLVLRSHWLRQFVLRTHRRALQAILPRLPHGASVAIVGGGLFPRTALIVRELMPDARITIIDASRANLDTARRFVDGQVEFTNRRFFADQQQDCDLLVIPLAFDGDRDEIYRHPPARAVAVHDWIWRRRGVGCVVSPVLLKRVNLVLR